MNFERDRFAEHIESRFEVTGSEAPAIELELVEVSELRERPHQLSFSLVFLGPKSSVVDQGLYDLRHESLGDMQLFLVPIGITEDRIRLEAVFNFLREDNN